MGHEFANPRLASAVTNAGGLGIVSVYGQQPEDVVKIIETTRELTAGSIGAIFLTPDRWITADEVAPKGFRATAQGLFTATLSGIGVAAGGFAGGLLFEHVGAKEMYLVFCIFIALVLVFVSLVRRTLPPEKESGPLEHST